MLVTVLNVNRLNVQMKRKIECNMVELLRYYIKWKKMDKREYMLANYIYVKV